MGLVGELLERAARATPAADEDRTSGWWFRHAGSGPWWAGAVLAHGGTEDTDAAIAAAERFYAAHGAVAQFHVCPDCPPELDPALAVRGYRVRSRVSLLTSDVGTPAAPCPSAGTVVHLENSPGRGWLAVLRRTSGGDEARYESTLPSRVAQPQAFVTVLVGGEPVGIGRAVAEDGWTGVFSMATAPHARRRGVGRTVLAAIAGWAAQHDSGRLYLQVEQANEPADRLYEAAGFARLAGYHYRALPQPEQVRRR